LGRSVHVSRLGKKQISWFGLPPVVVSKIKFLKMSPEEQDYGAGSQILGSDSGSSCRHLNFLAPRSAKEGGL